MLACRLRKTKRASEGDRISLDSPELLVSANLSRFDSFMVLGCEFLLHDMVTVQVYESCLGVASAERSTTFVFLDAANRSL